MPHILALLFDAFSTSSEIPKIECSKSISDFMNLFNQSFSRKHTMSIEKIQDTANTIASNLRDEADKASKIAENVTLANKTFLETQLSTFTDLTNIAIEGTEKMIELNVAAAKESIDSSAVAAKKLIAKGMVSFEEMDSATKEAMDTAETNVTKTTNNAKKIVKEVMEK
jgi:hypothetical protein